MVWISKVANNQTEVVIQGIELIVKTAQTIYPKNFGGILIDDFSRKDLLFLTPIYRRNVPVSVYDDSLSASMIDKIDKVITELRQGLGRTKTEFADLSTGYRDSVAEKLDEILENNKDELKLLSELDNHIKSDAKMMESCIEKRVFVRKPKKILSRPIDEAYFYFDSHLNPEQLTLYTQQELKRELSLMFLYENLVRKSDLRTENVFYYSEKEFDITNNVAGEHYSELYINLLRQAYVQAEKWTIAVPEAAGEKKRKSSYKNIVRIDSKKQFPPKYRTFLPTQKANIG